MRARWNPYSLWLFVLLTSVPALAAETPTGEALPTYVSDRFRSVAQRVIRQIATQQLAGACPDDQPLCEPVARSLAKAVASAVSGEGVSLQTTLNTFFVDSSTHIFLYEVLGPLYEDEGAREARKALAPLIRCLSGGLLDRGREQCRVEPPKVAELLKALDIVSCKSAVEQQSSDCKALDELSTRLKAGQRVAPANATRVLAAVMASEHIRRIDLSIYLHHLARFLGGNLEEGLFPAALAFLSEPVEDSLVKLILEYDKTSPSAVTDPAEDGNFASALKACHQSLEAFTAWQQARGTGTDYVEGLRRSLLRGQFIDLSPLTGLTRYGCTSGDKQAADAVASLARFSQFFSTPIQVHQVLERYGVPSLAAAALLDYVRTSDEQQFEAHLRQLLAFAIKTQTVHALTLIDLGVEEANPGDTSKRIQKLRPLSDAERVCQVQDLLALIDPAHHPHPAPPTQCYDLTQKAQVPVVAWTLDIPAGGLTSQLQSERARAVQHRSTELTAALGRPGALDTFWEELRLNDLLRAGRYLTEGKAPLARKTLARYGVELLISRVELRATALVGTTAENCPKEQVRTSIFTGLGAGCAASLLIRHAYYPIADFVWEQGFRAGNAPDVSMAVYNELLTSPLLDSTPIILNVGLGATYILGKERVWGRDGYGALTLIDKLGVAFYKETGPSRQFEVGVFAGGFLDALIRTAADTGEEERHWLLAAAVGWPRLGNLDLGVEFHLGAAMPFSYKPERIGFSAGVAVVVPFSAILEDDEEE